MSNTQVRRRKTAQHFGYIYTNESSFSVSASALLQTFQLWRKIFFEMLQECPITRPAYEDVLRRIEKLKEDQHSSNGSKEEEISYEEKLEVGKNIDMEEIEVGNDHHKNEEMAEKTKCSSPVGEIRVRNFALTNLGNI